jgi:hypothetical protein
MDTNLGDAISGLLLLGSDSINECDDGSTAHITNDSDLTPTSSSNGSLTPTSNAGSKDAAPTPPAAETCWCWAQDNLVRFGMARQVRSR